MFFADNLPATKVAKIVGISLDSARAIRDREQQQIMNVRKATRLAYYFLWEQDIEAYFNFVLGMFLAFGLAFEVPVVVVVLVLTGVISVEQLREFRGYVIVGIFTLAAFITPPDAVSMISLAIPMCLLYELGIVVGAMVAKRRAADVGETSRE